MEEIYIGTKIIAAEPMTESAFDEKYRPTLGNKGNPFRQGYKVRYEDGYISWSPKETFERAYRKMTPEEQAMILPKARV